MLKSKKYKTVQINISYEKHRDMIEWLINKAKDEETSLNSIIVRAIKTEYQKDGNNKKESG